MEGKKKKISVKMGMICVIAASTIWAWTGIAGQILSQEKKLDVYWIVSVRLILSGLILSSISFISKKKEHYKIWKNKNDVIQLLIFAIMGNALMQVSYFACISESNAATATILQYLAPALVIIAIVVKNRKRPSRMEAICTILALAGVFCIGTHGSFHSLALTPKALLWGMASAVSMAFYTAYPISIMRKYGSMTIVSWGILLAGIVMCAWIRPWRMNVKIDGEGILLMTILILLGTVIAFSVFSLGAAVIGGARASILGTVEPIVSAIVSFFVFQQKFVFFDYVGILCILAITVLLSLSKVE